MIAVSLSQKAIIDLVRYVEVIEDEMHKVIDTLGYQKAYDWVNSTRSYILRRAMFSDLRLLKSIKIRNTILHREDIMMKLQLQLNNEPQVQLVVMCQ